MSEKKTIQFNESLFNGGNNKTKKNTGKKQKKEKPKTLIKPNKLKKDLLEKIKKHQQQQKITNDKVIDNPVEEKHKSDFHNDFVNSIEYLNKISNKNKTEKQKKHKNHKAKSLKHKPMKGGNDSLHSQIQPIQNDPFVSIDLPTDFDVKNVRSGPIIHLSDFTSTQTTTIPESETPIPITMEQPVIELKKDPGWGCLKGGKKPTYRTFHNKTLKATPKPIITSSQPSRQQKLEELKKKHKKIRQKSKKTIKSKYNLGRSLKKGKMSILIKNNNTRRKIKKEHGLLKQKPLGEVKKYLYERNLLKIGSTAPNDVIRTLYEQAILAGEINNFSNDISLHNFISKE
jgi:hypothetical protein